MLGVLLRGECRCGATGARTTSLTIELASLTFETMRHLIITLTYLYSITKPESKPVNNHTLHSEQLEPIRTSTMTISHCTHPM